MKKSIARLLVAGTASLMVMALAAPASAEPLDDLSLAGLSYAAAGDAVDALRVGEDATVAVEIRNDGDAAVEALSATLQTDPRVDLLDDADGPLSIAPGETATFSFGVRALECAPEPIEASLALGVDGATREVALGLATACVEPEVRIVSVDVTEVTGDGPSRTAIGPGTSGRITINLANDGEFALTGVRAELDLAYADVADPILDVPDIAAGEQVSIGPFEVSMPGSDDSCMAFYVGSDGFTDPDEGGSGDDGGDAGEEEPGEGDTGEEGGDEVGGEPVDDGTGEGDIGDGDIEEGDLEIIDEDELDEHDSGIGLGNDRLVITTEQGTTVLRDIPIAAVCATMAAPEAGSGSSRPRGDDEAAPAIAATGSFRPDLAATGFLAVLLGIWMLALAPRATPLPVGCAPSGGRHGRAALRNRHVPVHGYRGFNAPCPATWATVPRPARNTPATDPRRRFLPRRR